MEGFLGSSLTIFAVMGFSERWDNPQLDASPSVNGRTTGTLHRLYAERDTRTVKFSVPKTREEAGQLIDRLSACPYREDQERKMVSVLAAKVHLRGDFFSMIPRHRPSDNLLHPRDP